MNYSVFNCGSSRSFPEPHEFLDAGKPMEAGGADALVMIGLDAGDRLDAYRDAYPLVLVELYTECLGVWTGEAAGAEGSHVLGFARFRMGDDAPSNLIELVRQPATPDGAVANATALFEAAGFEVAVCMDQAGRIIDRLVRPYFNEVLQRLDEGLATADDMDLTLKLGLGYPEGPVGLLERSGLAHHYDVTCALNEVYGTPAFAPARRAVVANRRRKNQNSENT